MQLGDGEFAAVRAGMTVWLESLFPRRRLLREIRASWAKPGEKDAWLADRYFALTRSGDELLHLDEQTWNDLEFPRIFAQLDTTITRLGSQCLFRQMRTYARTPAQAQELYQRFQALRRDRDLREHIQLTLMSLNADSAARVVEALFDSRIEGPKRPALIIGWSVVSLGLAGAMSVSLIPLGMTLGILGVNVAISARTASRRYRLIETLRGVFGLISVAEGARTDPHRSARRADRRTGTHTSVPPAGEARVPLVPRAGQPADGPRHLAEPCVSRGGAGQHLHGESPARRA